MGPFAGVAFAAVVDTNDPLRQGRVRVRLPSLPDAAASWARVTSAPDGSRVRFNIQDEVVIAFEHGDLSRPVVLGALWNGSEPPPAANPALALPTGASLRPVPGHSVSSRTGASVLNVLQQAAPWLASMACQLRILAALKPLIDLVQASPAPPRRVLVELANAAADLAPCLQLPTPVSAMPVARGVLCLTIAALKSAIEEGAPDRVPVELGAALQGILDLSVPFFAHAGIEPVQLGALTDQKAVQHAIDLLQGIAETLGGCG